MEATRWIGRPSSPHSRILYALGRAAGVLSHPDGSNGVHRGVLDPTVSDSGRAWPEGISGQCAFAKDRPGRKGDVSDCEWIQCLHSVGLLEASFRPPKFICGAHSLTTPQQPAPDGRRTHAAHTEVSQPDEPADSSRVERHNGFQWAGHPGCDPGRQP
jgi:hypothetical protein